MELNDIHYTGEGPKERSNNTTLSVKQELQPISEENGNQYDDKPIKKRDAFHCQMKQGHQCQSNIIEVNKHARSRMDPHTTNQSINKFIK